MQETQTDSTIKIQIPGFNVFRGDVKRGWSGTAILVESNIPVRNLKITREDVHSTSIECKFNDCWHRFSSFYFPQNKLSGAQIKNFFKTNNNTFFGGDTNARHTTFGDNSTNFYGSVLYDILISTDLKIFNSTTPTCLKSVHGSFIDKFISNSTLYPIDNIGSFDCFSDHLAISCHIPLSVPNAQIFRRNIRLFNIVKTDKINSYILKNLQRQVLPTKSNLFNDDCEQIAENIVDIFNKAIDKYVPVAKTNHYLLLSPVTRAIQDAIKYRYRGVHKFGRLAPEHITRPIKNEIKLLRVMLLNMINSETAKFFTNIYNSIDNNKRAYRVIRNYTGHKKVVATPAAIFSDANKIDSVAGSENIANALANKFSANHNLTGAMVSEHESDVHNFVSALDENTNYIKFNEHITPDLANLDDIRAVNGLVQPEYHNYLTSIEEVSEIIKTRPNKNSTGLDSMPYTIIKGFDSEIIRGLTIFFNHLLAISYFPKIWQHANIVPIPKPGKDSGIVDNWRPISMLFCLSKIFERVLAKRITQHTRTLNLFQNQFGFQSGNSTIHALGKLQSDINRGLNHKKVTTLVALDLRAAFDTMWHDGLLFKLNRLNFPIHLIKLIGSMLKFRSFSVGLAEAVSRTIDMSAGIPQGSVTGPPLFNLYTYDIPLRGAVNILQFADDTTLYITHNNPGEAQGKLNSYLATLSDWFKNWKLLLNENKTELIHILGQAKDTNPRLRKNTRNIKIMINGHLIKPSGDIRLLGLQLQTNNRFTKNITIRINKARTTKFHLNKIFRNKNINTRIKTNMYKLYIRPILMYASQIWCRQPQTSSHQMERIRVFERKCLRSTANIKRARNSYKHVNATDIYKSADCIRIDRFAIQNNISFFAKCKATRNNKFEKIVKNFHYRPYQCMPHYKNLHDAGRLLQNDKLLIFNAKYNGQNGSVYNTNQ